MQRLSFREVYADRDLSPIHYAFSFSDRGATTAKRSRSHLLHLRPPSRRLLALFISRTVVGRPATGGYLDTHLPFYSGASRVT